MPSLGQPGATVPSRVRCWARTRRSGPLSSVQATNAPPAPSEPTQGLNLALYEALTLMPPDGQSARAAGAKKETLASRRAAKEEETRERMAGSLTGHRCAFSRPFVPRRISAAVASGWYQVAREGASIQVVRAGAYHRSRRVSLTVSNRRTSLRPKEVCGHSSVGRARASQA